ncbi:MAG: HAMP domain-containing protein [Syntrophobacteraceae bacterium]|nr:HAMP domain-containing protein [Syntrophobacteraceae bacterium]
MVTFRKKILVGYGASLILVVVVLAWAMFLLLRLGRASDSILQENYRSILAAENMIDAIERQDSAVLLILLGFKGQGHDEFHTNEAIFLQWLGRAKDNITIAGEREVVESIERDYTQYLIEVSQMRLGSEEDHARAVSAYHAIILPHFRSVRDACVRLRELNHETMYAASNRAHQLAVQAVFSISLVGGLSVATGVLFSLFLSRLISRPVRELEEAVLQVAKGDYEVRLPVRGSSELSLLAGHFNVMAEKLKGYHELNIGKLIAEKRKSEAIIQSVDDGILVVDESILISDMNTRASGIFGVTREESLGRHFLETVKDERLFHLDTYRIESAAEAEELDLDSMLVQGPLLIEWPERVKAILPAENLWVTLEYIDENGRQLVFTATGARHQQLLEQLFA